MQFTIIKYEKTYKHLWDQFVGASKNGTFLFYRDFMEYHSHRFEDHSLMVYEGKKLCALLPANVKGNTLFSHQGLTYGGLILSSRTRLVQAIRYFREILVYAGKLGITEIQIKDVPAFYHRLPSGELEYIAHLSHAVHLKAEVASVIDYRYTLPLHRSRSGGLKKAKRAQLMIKETTDFKGFWNLILIPNLQRRHQARPTHTLDEILLLATRFPKNIRQFNVYERDQLVAGATLFVTDAVAHVQYISANERKQELGSLDFLFEYLIFTIFNKKDYFDFGTSNESDGLKLNGGLQSWKESFGARAFVQHTYQVRTNTATKLENVLL